MRKHLLLRAKDIAPSREDFEVIGVFNPAVTKFNDEILMLIRVAERPIQNDENFYLTPIYDINKGISVVKIPKGDKDFDFSDKRVIKNHKKNYLTSISHFVIATSKDGLNFVVANERTILPSTIYEEYGLEDARITKIGESFYITYVGISSYGINVGLIQTDDFRKFKRLGNIFHSDNKDCVIFPQKINGKYFALHRPSISHFGKLDIWTAESDNLNDWGNHKILLGLKDEQHSNWRIGAGATPILIDGGWLEIFHMASPNDEYFISACVLDKDDPNKVVLRSKDFLIEPTEEFEKIGFVNNVVFTCGLIREDANVTIYYGACDENIACVTLAINDILAKLEKV